MRYGGIWMMAGAAMMAGVLKTSASEPAWFFLMILAGLLTIGAACFDFNDRR